MQFNENIINHKYFIPTYEECREICDAHDNFLFFESKHNVDGFNISIFSYRLVSQSSIFEKPVPGNNKISANEVRGITFVFNKDGSLYDRYLLLDKFWNMNQSECSMYSVVKEYKIKNIYDKLDGSIASFVKLPNGRVVGKSKASFESSQAIEIENIYKTWPNIRKFVDWCFDNDIISIFEYISPTNRIVVPYANTDLVLLRMRNNTTGEYLDINDYIDKLEGISVAQSFGEHTLDELVEISKVIEGKEGWIVQFENGKMIKIKSDWYLSLHGLFTQELNRENTLILLIIDEKMDDILAQLGPDAIDKRNEVDKITNKINNYISKVSKDTDILLSKYTGDRKEFAIKYNKDKLFPIAISVINGKDKIETIKNKIKVDTKNLMIAREWLQKN